MATPSEQKALAFVAMIVLLGGVVRVVRAGAPAVPSVGEQQALARQATAAESAAAATSLRSARGGRAPRTRRGRAEPVTPGSGPLAAAGGAASSAPMGIGGYPPPGPRIDVDYRTNRPENGSAVIIGGASAGGVATSLVDLDRASEPQIDPLPRVGPALARRLVANRDSFGAFGSLDALGRVRGFGPATRKRLAPLVTFSGRPSSRP
jgi:DNA uptake protein ComE-like DNA-binding protein